jgi:hypothetical protein
MTSALKNFPVIRTWSELSIPLQNSITTGFTESPQDPTARCGGFTVFHGRSLYTRPRGELDSISYSIFRFVCVALFARPPWIELPSKGDRHTGVNDSPREIATQRGD